DCPFWTAVFDRAIGGIDQVDADAMQDFWRRNHELLGPNRRLYATAAGRRRLAEATDCTAIMEAIYLAAHEVSGARVLFDTSKALMAPIVLRSSRVFNTRLMQLVRDPRAVCYSWATPKPDPTRGE